jgi:oxygen-dependent protoporphyrinogen oxidase
MSQLFPGRAPADHDLLQCMLGGVRRRDLIDDPDDRIVSRTLEDLDSVLGVLGDPDVLGVTRWPRAIPQPGRGHVRRMNEVRTRVCALPGLALAGSYVTGVGVSDSFASGLAAAEALSSPV